MRSLRPFVLLTLVAASVHAAEPVRAARPGLPLPGLSAEEIAEYNEGFAAFRAHLFSHQGLGPTFNGGTRCYHCHRGPALGGQSKRTVTRFGRIVGGTFDPLAALGGSLLQEKAISPDCAEFVPVTANVVIQRNATSTLGAGLVEAIPDQQIVDRALAELVENPAMAGRVHMVTGVSDGLPHVGRFGWKAQGALIVDVAAEAMVNELGFTNALFPAEEAPNGDLDVLARCDLVPDPEDVTDFLGKVTHLLRFLSPMPPRARMSDVTVLGEGLFHSIGCAFCHYAGYTAVSSIPAIDGKSVDLYSDLLLHDIGTGDGIVQGDAGGNEFRAAPLWVVRSAAPYLHDGRARTLEQAIDAHQGQALDVRNAYFSLSRSEQNAVQKFLKKR
jgi:CxxC motif-containing protein (DUF1111 family)